MKKKEKKMLLLSMINPSIIYILNVLIFFIQYYSPQKSKFNDVSYIVKT